MTKLAAQAPGAYAEPDAVHLLAATHLSKMTAFKTESPTLVSLSERIRMTILKLQKNSFYLRYYINILKYYITVNH
ncbi:hypothetical protein [Burkholderia cenocepacia]|uniref:hypothetical protein n=2 Tax=Burkholderia TaxID=32008 RepID=UPI00158D687A|nr:hypothetical protein [Burkholderia cenocepacia]